MRKLYDVKYPLHFPFPFTLLRIINKRNVDSARELILRCTSHNNNVKMYFITHCRALNKLILFFRINF